MAKRPHWSASLKITIMVEGKTESAFMPHLREFLKNRLDDRMPNLDPFPVTDGSTRVRSSGVPSRTYSETERPRPTL